MKTVRKKAIFIILTLAIGLLYLYDSYMYLETHRSPDGNYKIVIKRAESIFTSKMPGNGGSGGVSVEVILKTSGGKIISRSSYNNQCRVFDSSIEIRWDLENNKVWYGRGKVIDLQSGKVQC